MKIKNTPINLFLILLSFCANAQNSQLDYNQNLRSYTLSSPDVSNFEKYSLNRANHYVGKLDVSIPIYTIKSGGITYPVNLVYNTGGVKVDQVSSDVGLGWNMTRAVLTRTVNHSNDFDNTGRLQMQADYNSYSAEDKLNNSLMENFKIGYFLQRQNPIAVIGGYTDVDFIPDVYHFYCDGFSTSFFFDGMNTPVEINPQGTKIVATASKVRIDTRKGNFNQSNVWVPNHNFLTHDFFNIVITTSAGIRYTFSDCDYSISQLLSGYQKTESPAEISAWHVSMIEDTKSGKKLEFTYENTSSNPNHPAGSAVALDKKLAQRNFGYSVNTEPDPEDPLTYFYNSSISDAMGRIDIQKKRIKKIIFDQGELEYNYNNAGVPGALPLQRTDLYNGDCITQIYLRDKNSNLVKSFNFSYDYFTSNYNVGEFNPDGMMNTYRYKRLKLTQFWQSGKNPYKFTYDESSKLPPLNSFSVDFLGYYNASPDVTLPSIFEQTNPIPTLYYYQNQFEKSLLPYPVSGLTPTVIPGYFNRQANEYAKIWSLSKMEYPTGGHAQYSYESNQFDEFGQAVKGGGIRIAQQQLNDGAGGVRTISYSYQKEDGSTSGRLSSSPYFGFPTHGNFNYSISYPVDGPAVMESYGPNFGISWQLFDKSNLNADLTIGSYVGYSRVTEREQGRGRTEFKFTSNELAGYKNVVYRISPQSLPSQLNQLYFDDLLYTGRVDQGGNPEYRMDGTCDWVIANSGVFSNVFTDNSYKRGKLLEEKIFDESNRIQKKTTLGYSDNVLTSYKFYQGFAHITNFPVYISPYENNYYETYIRTNLEAYVTVRKDIKISQFLVSEKTVETYDDFGNANVAATSFTYNGNGLVAKSQASLGSSGTSEKRYYYPGDSQLAGEPNISELVSKNILGNALKTESYLNGAKLFEEKIVYANDLSTSNALSPKYMYSRKGSDADGALEKKLTYDKYDDMGNLLQYSTETGEKVCLVWGYGKTQPIAKIEGIEYAVLPANLILAAQVASNGGNEQSLLAALANFRSALPGAKCTTYTYRPLVGISTETDAKGEKISFIYDELNRLKWVKDNSGNILKEHQYHYKQ